MTWRWLVWWRPRGNGEAAKHAAESAKQTLAQAHRQTWHVDRTAARGRDIAVRSDWFTQDMEQAFTRRGQV